MTDWELSLRQMVDIQVAFDEQNFSGAETPDDKRRHIFLHLGKLMGKFSGLEEQADHGYTDTTILRTDIIPDLLVYAAQLAELEDVDLTESYRNRLEFVAERNGNDAETVDGFFEQTA